MTLVSSLSVPKMTNRHMVLDLISHVMRKIKNAGSRAERFDLLDNVQILSDILKEVTAFEAGLITSVDID